MSGICAVVRKHECGRTGQTLASMCTGLLIDPSEQTTRLISGRAGVGAAVRFTNQQTFEDPEILVACHAELYNERELRKCIGSGSNLSSRASTAALLAGLYGRFGTAFVEKLRGNFSLVLWDRQ